ncbi:MAG: Uma2 family endonuclease [Planctomycetota bacterium]
MDWSEIVDNPYLQDLPFKIEQDGYGNIVMSPASNWHNRRQVRIAKALERHLNEGESFVECSVQTTKGVKVPDVVWQSSEHFAAHGDSTPMSIAPEVCVEVLSPSNSTAEIEMKTDLYFGAGAIEVWVCDTDGVMTFRTEAGIVERSELAPEFPQRID